MVHSFETESEKAAAYDRLCKAVGYTETDRKIAKLFSILSCIVNNLKRLDKNKMLDLVIEGFSFFADFVEPNDFDNEEDLPF